MAPMASIRHLCSSSAVVLQSQATLNLGLTDRFPRRLTTQRREAPKVRLFLFRARRHPTSADGPIWSHDLRGSSRIQSDLCMDYACAGDGLRARRDRRKVNRCPGCTSLVRKLQLSMSIAAQLYILTLF